MLQTIRLKSRYLDQMTDDEFFEFCQANPDLRIERSKNLEIIIMSPTGSLSGKYSGEVFGQLYSWNSSYRLGEVFDSSTGFTLPDQSVRSPDACWISAERWAALSPEAQEKFAPICPDFVIEISSPSDSLAELQEKMTEWMENGCRLAWMINPQQETVTIYRENSKTYTQNGFEKKVSGENILTGFELDLSRLKK
ncbi:MAG: Uma2 family endonuclease [Bacteroidia bacterium]|nr:Uma2 family endonuclease [Bacteroidia bacterium]